MTKKINRDHGKKKHHPLMQNEAIVSHLSNLLTPLIFNQQALFRSLGLRNRILNLPLMIAAVLTLLWRNVPSVRELTRILNREGFLWVKATKVSQKALSERFLTFPSIFFEEILKELEDQDFSKSIKDSEKEKKKQKHNKHGKPSAIRQILF